MDEFKQIEDLLSDEVIKYGLTLTQGLGTEFVLGQTSYVCKYGTLSDGHEKITDSQKYHQANKEIYFRALNMSDQRAHAMESQACLLEAQDMPEATEAQRLRKQAAILRAKTAIKKAYDNVRDQLREIKAFDEERRRLEPIVKSQYPLGIEQSEEDNWAALFEYRMQKEKVPGMAREHVHNIPLEPALKAALGYQYGRIDAIAPLALTDTAKCQRIEQTFQPLLTKTEETVTNQETN